MIRINLWVIRFSLSFKYGQHLIFFGNKAITIKSPKNRPSFFERHGLEQWDKLLWFRFRITDVREPSVNVTDYDIDKALGLPELPENKRVKL